MQEQEAQEGSGSDEPPSGALTWHDTRALSENRVDWRKKMHGTLEMKRVARGEMLVLMLSVETSLAQQESCILLVQLLA